MPQRQPAWTNIFFLAIAHAVAAVGVWYMFAVHFSWATLALAFVWMTLVGMAVTGGYHRLFAHRSYRARPAMQPPYLLFGAAAVQNSALKWSADHRIHHEHCDGERDPYNITRGFWWAHVGWVLFDNPERAGKAEVADLAANPLVRFQDRFYVPIAAVFGVLLPMAIASLWGDALGGFLAGGFVRLIFQWHATFSINSFAHWIGTRPYCLTTSARDSVVTALISFGEGYHNFHHRFQADYRNGVRWYHFDPTKWFVWTCSKLRITWDLRRTPAEAIRRARAAVAAGIASGRLTPGS